MMKGKSILPWKCCVAHISSTVLHYLVQGTCTGTWGRMGFSIPMSAYCNINYWYCVVYSEYFDKLLYCTVPGASKCNTTGQNVHWHSSTVPLRAVLIRQKMVGPGGTVGRISLFRPLRSYQNLSAKTTLITSSWPPWLQKVQKRFSSLLGSYDDKQDERHRYNILFLLLFLLFWRQ